MINSNPPFPKVKAPPPGIPGIPPPPTRIPPPPPPTQDLS